MSKLLSCEFNIDTACVGMKNARIGNGNRRRSLAGNPYLLPLRRLHRGTDFQGKGLKAPLQEKGLPSGKERKCGRKNIICTLMKTNCG